MLIVFQHIMFRTTLLRECSNEECVNICEPTITLVSGKWKICLTIDRSIPMISSHSKIMYFQLTKIEYKKIYVTNAETTRKIDTEFRTPGKNGLLNQTDSAWH